MTIAKDFASKVGIAFVALAMIFSMSVPASSAQQTPEDLQKMINELLAQIAALQAGTSTTASGYTWTRDLKVGATGADVMELQKFLNKDADTRVAATGAGSAGMETSYFGPATAAAVSKFQVKYRADILSPAGLVNPTGFFGPSTRAKANALNKVTAPTPGDDDEDENDDDEDKELSGEAELDTLEVEDPADSQIEENQEDAEIAEVTVKFKDGDAEIDRIDISLLADGQTNTNTVEPWDVFENISLWVDGEKIAEEDASDEDNWLDEDDGTFRFPKLDLVAEEDEDLEITIAATIQNGLETSPAEIGDWDVQVEEIRYFDADGVSTDDDSTDGINSDTATFEIQEEGDEDELFIRSSVNDPAATTFELESDEKSDFMTVFKFDLDTEDSINDIEVKDIQVDINATQDGSTATTTSNLISDVQLVVNGEIFDDVTMTHSTTGAATGTFAFDLSDEDFVIDAGDRVEVEFQVEFKALTSAFEGATIEATVDTTGLTAEGAESLSGNQLSGSATSEEHTLRTEGAALEAGTMTETLKVNDDTSVTDDEGVFTIKFDVTAFESDIYVSKSAASGTTATSSGANFLVEDSNGNQVATGTSVGSLTSTADTDGTRFVVNEGETETFTLTVEYDPATAGFYQLQLYSFNFSTTNAAPTEQQLALPASDYETDALSI